MKILTVFAMVLSLFIISCDNVTDNTTALDNNVVLENVVKISSLGDHTMALKSDGTVWVWGTNKYGVLALREDYKTNSNVALQVRDINNAVDIAAGEHHCLVLTEDGTVYAWGYNFYNQLGTNEFVEFNHQPKALNLPKNIIKIYAGADFGFALTDDGFVYGWGSNVDGCLGNGNITEIESPVRNYELSNITSISISGYSVVALDASGNIWTWGNNNKRILGRDNENSDYRCLTPGLVTDISNVKEIHAADKIYAVTNDNKVIELGINNHEVENLSNLKMVISKNGIFYAVKDNGDVISWKEQEEQKIKDTDNEIQASVPNAALPNLSGIMTLAAGAYHFAVLESSGIVKTWGNNSKGQLGNATYIDSQNPVRVQAKSYDIN